MTVKVVSATQSFGRTRPEVFQMLREAGVELVQPSWKGNPTEADLVEAVKEASGLIVSTQKVTERVIAAAPDLRIIMKYGAGLDNVDVEAAQEHGVQVANTGAANADAVADFTIGLLLSVSRWIPRADAVLKSGGWERLLGHELWGKTVGIVGLGAIGRRVALRLAGFNVTILAFDVAQDPEFAARHGVRYTSLDDLLSASDFVTVHAPALPETKGLFNYNRFARMKRSAYFVNVARGALVDEEGLCQALKEGLIAGAALDVFAQEPPVNSPLLSLDKAVLDKLVLTPHMGAYSREAFARMDLAAAEGVLAALRGMRAPGNGTGR
ncbi:MAG: phosphoglycerate dehydrogenase [Bacillota bacterium]|nr:phosphoglycerate dehydrogenase [Bacillota bacterium]